MGDTDRTCWTMIQGAAAGARREREEFARRYSPVIRAYLGARWRDTPRRDDVEDAVQDVFVECFREGGALDRVERDRNGGFRAFFYSVVTSGLPWMHRLGEAHGHAILVT